MMLSKKIKNIIFRANLVLDKYNHLRIIDSARISRFVFVCHGNVCRSPYAEAVVQSYGFSALSCGIDVRRSAPAEAMAIRAAELKGKDISRHTSRSFLAVEFGNSDCIVAMDPTHLPVSQAIALCSGAQLTLMGIWMKPPIAEIVDPYGKDLDFFCQCYDKIDQALICMFTQMKLTRQA